MFFMLKSQFLRCSGLLAVFIWLLSGVASVYGKNVEITILATADLHGETSQIRQVIAPLVKDFKRRQPDSVIYVDSGDTAQGTFAVNRLRGKGVLTLLGEAGCDIWVPGNHEIEYGFEAFKSMVREFPGKVLAANLLAPELADKVGDLAVVEKKGVKIAFIGLMLKDMNNCFPVAEKRFQTLPGAATLQRSVQRAKAQGAEVIVLLRHAGKYGGGENLHTILRNTPEISLVIGAHTHIAEPGCRIGNAWYVQPPAYGNGIAVVKLFFDPASRQVVQIESQLQKLKKVHTYAGAAARKKAPVPVGKNENFAAEAIRRALNCDLAIYAVGSREKLQKLLNKKSPVVNDYFRVFPYYDPIVKVTVSGGEFQAILREYSKFAYKRKQFLSVDGCKFSVRKGKLQSLEFAVSKDRYTLAVSAFAAAGAGGQLPGVRRILYARAENANAENAPAILDILCKNQLAVSNAGDPGK